MLTALESAAAMSNESINIEGQLDLLFSSAAHQAFGDDVEFNATVRPSKHADFQINGGMALGKKLGTNPRDVGAKLVESVETGVGVIESTELAGPGFVNVIISNTYLTGLMHQIGASPTNGLAPVATPKKYVIDYAAPNIAKNMHVGHLRTSIIGDSFVRMLEFQGHHVIKQDHQGDWGTQFGMLIEHLVDSGDPQGTAQAAVHDLDGLYKQARAKFDSDETFAGRARARVVQLQTGDSETIALWNVLVNTSREYFYEVYAKLGILLTEADARGESFYNDMLDDTVQELIDKGLAKEDDGALCVYPDGFAGRDNEPFAMIIRKSDGGYNYATTDLATIRYSVDTLKGDYLLYVVDARQSNHFNMVFAVARAAGWLPETVVAKHIGYGTVMGPDNKPFKTRSGETVQLISLLDEAVDRADKALSERTTDLTSDQQRVIAEAVGIGAIKWADLKNEHTSNYVFDLDRMVAFQGNTGPYVQYASTRAKSVIRKAGVDIDFNAITITEVAEHRVGSHDCRLPQRRRAQCAQLRASLDGRVRLRNGRIVHRLLREMPGAFSRDGRDKGFATGSLLPVGSDNRHRPRAFGRSKTVDRM